MPATVPLSVLDVSPITSGSDAAAALANTLDLARLADDLGYARYWLAEHHNAAGIASSAPEVMIPYVAGATRRIRVGSGGIMLPNHSPLHMAEAFGLLATMHPGRIDLGVGRAPGTDTLTALALRGEGGSLDARSFPDRLAELAGFLHGGFPADHPYASIRPAPRADAPPEMWILGSTGFTAELAGRQGLGFAFAQHIGMDGAAAAMRTYREHFVPSAFLSEPRTILATSVVLAPDDAEAEHLAASVDLMWLRIALNQDGPLPSPEEALTRRYSSREREVIAMSRRRHIVGDPAGVRLLLDELLDETAADELMVMSLIHDHGLRRRAYELLARMYAPTPAS